MLALPPSRRCGWPDAAASAEARHEGVSSGAVDDRRPGLDGVLYPIEANIGGEPTGFYVIAMLARSKPSSLIRILRGACVLVPLGSATSVEAQWPTKEFTVVSGEYVLDPVIGPVGQLLVDVFNASPGPLIADAFNAASAQLDEWLAAWDMEPTGARMYVADPEVRKEIEQYLSEAAALLEKWGFPEPELPVRDGKYQVVLALETPAALTGGSAAGTYHPRICGVIGGVLFFRANDILEPSAEGGSPAVKPRGRSTLAHELFHAVQANTQFLRGSCPPGGGSWIVEGTARAIGLDVLRVLRDEEVPNWVEAWGGRDYSRRLPVPRRLGPAPAQWTAEDVAGYDTSSFWRYLAEYHAARVVGGGWPGSDHPGKLLDYSYLAFLFEQGTASIGCLGSGAACSGELRWLERGIEGWFNRSLREIYPRFAEVLALYGYRYGDSDAARQWRTRAFGDCPYVELTPQAQGRVHREVIADFQPVSMHCWTVLVNEFPSDVPVEVSVEGPPGGTALADLSIAVAGPPIWADTAVVQTIAGDQRVSVRWIVDASPSGGNYVVLTNVARDPVATTPMQNLPITFTALTSVAVASYAGSIEGGEGGEGFGDLADDIAAGGQRFVSGDPKLSVMVLPDYPSQCHLHLNFQSEIGDMVDLNALLPQPLTEATYPIRAIDQGPSLAPSTASLQVRSSCERPGSECAGRGFGHISEQSSGGGTLRLLKVTPAIVVGEFESPMTGTEDYVLAGKFVSPLYGVWGRLPPDHPCSPSSSPSITGGKGQSGHGDEGGADEGAGGGGDEGGGGEEAGDPGAAGAPGGQPLPPTGGEDRSTPAPAGEPGAGPGSAGARPGSSPSAPSGALRGPQLVLDFSEDGSSVVRSLPQRVQGAGSAAGVALSSPSFDLTLAVPLDGLLECSMRQTDPSGYMALLRAGRSVDGALLLDVKGAELRLEGGGGDGKLELVIQGDGVEIRGTQPGALALEPGGPAAIRGDISGATLELSLDGEGFSCEGLMDAGFTLAEVR